MSRTPNAPHDTDDIGTPGLTPPTWAARSVPEDGGITHERVSRIRPLLERWTRFGNRPAQTEVSLSTVDRPSPEGWNRETPTVQVEGGSYSLDGARQLRAALDEILAYADSRHATSRAMRR